MPIKIPPQSETQYLLRIEDIRTLCEAYYTHVTSGKVLNKRPDALEHEIAWVNTQGDLQKMLNQRARRGRMAVVDV